MHIYISGIGGSGMSSLANLALDGGFLVSGSDLKPNFNTDQLTSRGVQISFDQTGKGLSEIDSNQKVYWFIHSSSISKTNPEWQEAYKKGLNISKREDLINFILHKKNLKLISVAGTHGKTTTTAMFAWVFDVLKIPVSYLIGSNISWNLAGKYQENSKYLIMEADEYDKNFLNYNSDFSIITSLDYDHPDTYPNPVDYLKSFEEFVSNSKHLVAFEEDFQKLNTESFKNLGLTTLKRKIGDKVLYFQKFRLLGLHNRQNASLVASLFDIIWQKEIHQLCPKLELSNQKIQEILSTFPGTKRRMEKLGDNLYSDYAHHPTEIKATIQLASEMNQKIIVVYQPHQNLRQHQVYQNYTDCLNLASKIYWLPTFLVREKTGLEILTPQKITQNLQNQNLEFVDLDTKLENKIQNHLKNGDLVIALGAGNIDDWFRNFAKKLS
jgi:UDP-N-acetylmuramate--alanine ligase